ncbi:MAG: hypothetical protein HY901_14950 [Deltaproteobacteria bacterium]|nr:hypothetical protein [Deltaproteobacteria bacterium]
MERQLYVLGDRPGDEQAVGVARRGHHPDAEAAQVEGQGPQDVDVGLPGVAAPGAHLAQLQGAPEELAQPLLERAGGDHGPAAQHSNPSSARRSPGGPRRYASRPSRWWGPRKDVSRIDALLGLTRLQEQGLGHALVQAFVSLGEATAEGGLLDLLGQDLAAVSREAAAGLGAIGTIRSIESLLPLAEGVLTDAALRDVARAAIRSIQARLGDAAAGKLSVAEAGSGNLSVVEGNAGEGGLSLSRTQ